MKKAILALSFISILLLHSASDALSLSAKSKIDTSSSPVISLTASSHVGAAPTISQHATAAPISTAPSSPTIAPPADIASLTAKEILAANNQVVNQVASMYQNLGLFITIIVTLVGGVATWMSYVARKSVHEFIQEWSKKLESVENEMKESLKRLRDLVGEAEGSANKAAKHAQSIEDSEKVLNKTLESVDNLRAYVASLDAQQRGEQAAATHPQPIAEAAPVQPSSEPQAADEDADVTSRLKGKINPAESEGPKP